MPVRGLPATVVSCDGDSVGVADVHTLIPEVEYVGVEDRDVVAILVADRPYRVVTTVEYAVVDSDVVVVIAEEDYVGIC